jgi:D-alanyl-D-alanine carboxypeptidase (penicillin-binding protein 5/6)
MKKLFAALCVSASLWCSAHAQQVPIPTVAAKSWLLLDVTSGQVLGSNQPDMRVEPASLVKLMTAYLSFAAVRDKKIDMNQMVAVSARAWKVDRSSAKMFIDPATPVSVSDLLHGLIVQSGNDASVALAEAVAGSEEAFVRLMNQEARRMGMSNTRFANSNGLPGSDNYSTASDLSILASRLVTEFPEFYKIYATKSFTYNRITQQNRNRLLWLDPTVDGMKTGHTPEGGYGLISSAKRPNGARDRRLIAVVMGANSQQSRAQESQRLLNWGFQNFDTVRLYAKEQPVATLEVWKGVQGQVKVGFKRDVFVTLPKGQAGKLITELERKKPLVAPIAKNSRIGRLMVSADGRRITDLPVLALEQVGQASVFGRAWDSIRMMLE